MRWLIIVLLAACGDDGGSSPCMRNGNSYKLGDVFPAGDGCNSCTCSASGVSCTEVACPDAGIDANPASCAPANGCPEGPACGALCCNSGERCDNGACKCGMNAACGTGDNCEAAGPIGGNRCGAICCGVTGPCPQ